MLFKLINAHGAETLERVAGGAARAQAEFLLEMPPRRVARRTEFKRIEAEHAA